MSYTDSAVTVGSTYVYRVAADNAAGTSAWSNVVTVPVAVPAAPTILTGTAVRQGGNERATITNVGAVTTYTTGTISRTANWYFRMAAVNVLGQSGWSNTQTVTPAP